MLRVEQIQGEPRFDFLRTIYAYAQDQLVASGEPQLAHRKHADYYLSLAERARKKYRGPERTTWLDRLEREHDNLRGALSWLLAQGEAETASRLGDSVGILWAWRGHDREGRAWLTRILAVEGDVAPGLRAKVLNGLAQFECQQGDLDSAEEHSTEAWRLTRSVDDQRGMTDALRGLGHVARQRNDLDRAVSCWRESLALEHALGADPYHVAGTLGLLAAALARKKDFGEAVNHVRQALAIAQDVGDLTLLAENYLTLSEVALAQKDYPQAREYATKSRSLAIEIKYAYGCAATDLVLGWVALAGGAWDEAEKRFTASLSVMHALLDPPGCAESLEGMACLAATRGVMQRAARLWGAAEAIRLPLGPLPDDSNRPGYERYITPMRAKMREQTFHSAKQDGAAMSLAQAMHFALEPSVAESSMHTPKSIRKPYPAGLSVREVEVLALVAQGLTDGEVAERLVLSIRTVHAHLTSIYNKLGVNSRVAATRFALEQKLV